MFRFLELSLHGWDLWEPVRLPLGRDVILVTGPNGSGKTTLLDAIRQLLNAPRLSSKRRLQNYLRHPDAPALIRAVVSNEDAGGGKPFLRERITGPEATLACGLIPAGGSPEKRFAILPGRPSVEELRKRLLESRDFYTPERYSRALEHAGVTKSLMGILAIEQGRTNALFDLSPRELFTRVLEMLGDQAVLRRYQEARRRYEESEREVGHQMRALLAKQADLNRVLREVDRLDAWERARNTVEDLDARLPATQLQSRWRQRNDATTKLPELRTRVRNGEAERDLLARQESQARDDEVRVQAALQAAREAEHAAHEHWAQSRVEVELAAKAVADHEAAEHAASALPTADLAALTADEDAAARAVFAAAQEVGTAKQRATLAADQHERLKAGLPVYPAVVERTVAALAQAGIGATLLAATVDVADVERGEASEAALGEARFSLLVPARDEATAIDVARAHQFPGPVYAGERTTAQEPAGPLTLLPGAPTWLRDWTAGVTLDQDGAWRDARGTWVAAPAERVLGAAGRQAALERAEREHEDTQAALGRAQTLLAGAEARRSSLIHALAQERTRQELLQLAAALPRARERARVAQERLAQDTARRKEAITAREAAESLGRAAFERRTTTEHAVEERTRRLSGERDALLRTEREVCDLDAEIALLTPQVRLDLREQAERLELVTSVDSIQRELDHAKSDFATLGEPPPPEIREEARHLRANVEDAEEHVKARQQEAGQARAELAECRRRYLDVVGHALHAYRRRAIDIGRSAAVMVEIEVPRLEDDDRVLDEAEIVVRLGFDGKDPLPLGHPEFSGGQQVIAGLILLMAMAETEGRGFFILDEPFAHLSLDRVDDVGRFLRQARAQFIITAPTTLDRAQLDPASLVIALKKKRSDAVSAPPPLIAEA